MDRVYRVIVERCIACGKCELACAFAHGSPGGQGTSALPGKTRINILRRGPDLGTPVVCLQCDDAACQAVCPVGALDWNAATGALEVDDDRCIRCRSCVAACPFGNMIWDEGWHRVAKCDLCHGDPKCVPFCPTHALEYVPADRAGRTPDAVSPEVLR